MHSAVETGILVAALVVVLYLAFGWLRSVTRDRREREHLGRLAGDGLEERTVPADSFLRKRMKAAGAVGPPEAYVLAASVLAAAAGLVTLRLIPAVPLAALMAMALGLYLPWAAMKEWAAHRASRFEQHLIGAIDLMTGALYAGGNLAQALRGAGEASDGPVRREFDEAVRRLALGMPFDRAFGRMAEGYPGEGITLFTQTLAAKQQAGGDLAPTLASLNETLRDRWRQQREVRAQLGGARMTAVVGVLMPYALAAVLTSQQPRWLDGLTGNPLGRPLIFIAVMLQIIGILWTWHILNRKR